MVKTNNFPGLFGIGCSIPFAIKAVKHLIFALQPNAATGMPRAIVFGLIAALILFFSIRSLIRVNTRRINWAKPSDE